MKKEDSRGIIIDVKKRRSRGVGAGSLGAYSSKECGVQEREIQEFIEVKKRGREVVQGANSLGAHKVEKGRTVWCRSGEFESLSKLKREEARGCRSGEFGST